MENKEYWQQLKEEYAIPLPEDNEINKWFLEDREQVNYLIERYGESSWNIHGFMELCRAEKISESHFRELVRYEMDNCFKKLKDERN
jgi:hypothetical protein